MNKSLPAQPSLVQLKHQAKDLLKEFRAGGQEALARFREHHPHSSEHSAMTLSDAQLVIGREYGFASWPKLKQHVELLTDVETRIARLQSEFASGDSQTKLRLLKPAHAKERFENYDPNAASLSYADARLLIANQEGYAYWDKYDSLLHLDPAVQMVISAVRTGDLAKLQEILASDPASANPKWVPGFPAHKPVPNDSIPLFCVSEGVWRRTNRQGNEYELTRALIAAGADMEIEGGLALASGVSFNVIRVVEALLDCGALADGVDRDGVPMAYAMHFGFTAVAELLAEQGAQLDLRFAAGLGRLELVKNWFNPDGSLKPCAGLLADPYGLERKRPGESPFRCERTRQNILSQALYFACVHKKPDVADFLLSQGADINAIVPGLDVRATVLHRIATMDAHEDTVIRFLLVRGADPEIRDEEHHGTPADWARYHKRDEVVNLLRSHQRSGG
jgi:ankyrin repeat protein